MLQLGMRLWAGIRCLETRRDERGVSGILDEGNAKSDDCQVV